MTAPTPPNTILGLDASTRQVTMAICQDNICLEKATWPSERGNPGKLAKEIAAICQRTNCPIHNLDWVLVGSGPGQYAGLRVSVTAAQMLQLPQKGQIAGITSAAAMLYEARSRHPEARAFLLCGDARRNHAWHFLWTPDQPLQQAKMRCTPIAEIQDMPIPDATCILSPDYERLHQRMPIPTHAFWHTGDVFPDAEYLIRAALSNPPLLAPPDIQYVHPPVSPITNQ